MSNCFMSPSSRVSTINSNNKRSDSDIDNNNDNNDDDVSLDYFVNRTSGHRSNKSIINLFSNSMNVSLNVFAWLSLVFLVFLFSSNQIHALNSHSSNTVQNVGVEIERRTGSGNIAKYRSIQLFAFERTFKLNLKLIPSDEFLSPGLESSNNKERQTNSSNGCFYRGIVDDDVQSIAYINLCHKGHVIGSFDVNNNEYFIEPIEEFDASTYEKNEFSFVDFDLGGEPLKTHLLVKTKSSGKEASSSSKKPIVSASPSQSATSSCGLDDTDSSNNKNASTAEAKRRSKRRVVPPSAASAAVVDRRLYLELLVVVDRKMFEYYDTNLENHILTLMFMVTQMYQHSSLINPIRVYITDIIYLHKLEERKYRPSFETEWEAEKTLNKFCEWQHEYKREANIKDKVDATILITKTDICKSINVCQTLGMARLNQICVSGQSCAVIEDSGINTAYTIAHEIGHLLGMKHVDEERCQGIDNKTTQMMASMLDLTKKSHAWSNCSVEDLNAFLRTGDAECLFNVPDKSPNFANRTLLSFDDTNEQFDERTILNALYPGSLQAYEIKHQCQQIFGPRSDACEQHLDDDCKILWCKSYETYSPEVAVHCVTTNTKWADGTPCGLSEYNTVPKICMNGECVSKSDSRALKEDGQWGSWSEFTPCSRSCGGGVRKRYRSCDNPKPKNGGKYCVGDRYHYESCNIQDCKLDESSFRDEQCRMAVQEISPQKMRDQMGFITNNTFLWKAYYSHDPRRKCILFCKLEDRPNFAMLRPMVVDGTKCGLNTFDICVNGHCLPGGCDNVLYSNKQNDNCGVCAGGNKSCQRTNYTLDTPNHFGYNKLSVIPPKSTNIFIHRQRDGDDLGCLVIRSASSFLLNGHYVISKTSTSIKFEGKFIDYIVNDTDEIIKSPGNFSQQLEIQFLAGSKKIYNNIKFIYHTPIITVAPRRPNGDQNRQAKSNNNPEIASAETSSSSSYSIGSGSSGHPGSARKAAFMRSQHQHREEDEVIRANNYKMPELFEKNITRVGQCDKLCNGVQIVYLNRCKKSGDECKPMQPETRSCNTECDLRVLASQGRCTPNVGDCGSGKLDVKVECIKIDKQSNLTRQVDLFHCDSNEVRSVYELYKNSQCYFPCDNFDWKLADSMCSCENGFKKQVYQCHDRLTNEVVNENKCQNRPKPKQDRVKCEVYCYKWRSGYWSECSKSCGTGVRYRTKYCIFNSTQIVDASYCKTSLPSSSQQEQSTNTIEYEYCNTEDCPQWSTSGWSLCSASSCGQTGKRQRRVTCLFKSSEVEANKCSSPAPTDSEDCLLDCDGVWRTSDWSECSVTCERGVRTRSVYCERKNGGGSNSDPMCDTKTRPTNSTECLIDEKCPKWIISSWSSCRGHCSGVGAQNGFRTRTVLCSTGTNSCDHLPKPLNFENCSLNCAHSRQWRAEEWSECNGDCNFGWKFRKVSCVDENNKPVSASECSMKDQPERRQRCMSCNGVWKAGQWDKCSNPCGKGVQTRLVECRAAFTNELLPASKCNPNSKMSDQRPCEELACKDELTFDWQIVSKGDCSVTCGLGWRLRRFECKNSRTNQTTTTSKCRSETQPTYYEQCNAGECPHWQHGGWSVCSSDCGEGHRRRLVACISPTGNTIEDRACSAASRPHDQEKCVSSCTKNSRWISGSWSDCDYRTCTKVRSVVCAHENGTRAQSETDCSRTEKPNYIAECDSRASCKHYQVTFSQPSTTTTTANMGHIHYTAWSSCSAKCGPGWRTRRAVCKSTQANNSTDIDMRYCGGARDIREPLVKDCNVAQCFYKVVEIWSQCSSSCGQQGLETLERRCFETVSRNFTDPVNCGIYPNVTKTVTRSCYRPCVRHVRHAFEWRATDWKPCSAKCGFGFKNRTIYCWSQQENKKANESYCVARNKPASTLPCMNVSCGFGWFVSEWSTCSKNCSTGIKSREVICAKISKEGHILNVTSNKCNMAEKPAHRITCNYGDCGGTYFWKPAKWSKCQPSCGFGYQKRTISCVDRFGNVQKDVGLCRKNSMPVTSQFCFTNCHMTSCSKLRSLFGVTKDGDYDLRISDKVVSIYCKSMNTTKPKEYITLKSGESQNFAEIYDKKLLEPSKCRIGPKYGGYCSFCKNETLDNHGIVLFSKVRFDVKTLTVIDDDFSFTNVIYGNPVPYGHSGDCYSSLPECQHARFNINFKGTGLVIDNSVKWINYGDKPHSKIVYAKDHSSVYGTCGGLCGFCRPDPQTGLKLRVV